jgi:hypothetical protein
VFRHYARGEAQAARGDASGVREEAQAITALASEPADKLGGGGADVAAIASIAAGVLDGRAALLAHAPGEAAAAFARAAQVQETSFPVASRFDPPPWWYPVRRSLAYAELAAGKPADAARDAEASLKDWPNDALALRVLADAEAALGDARAAAATRARAHSAWRGDLDQIPKRLT